MAPAGDTCLSLAEPSGLVSTGGVGRIVTGLIFGSGPQGRGGGPARISLPEGFPDAKPFGAQEPKRPNSPHPLPWRSRSISLDRVGGPFANV